MSQAEPNYREYKYLGENVKSTLEALEGLCQAKKDAEAAQKLFLQRHSQLASAPSGRGFRVEGSEAPGSTGG